MTDRPIIMSAAMVRALLDGRKTQTRRLAWRQVITHPECPKSWLHGEHRPDGYTYLPTIWQKVKPGDRLYVRETWGTDDSSQDLAPPRQLASFDRVGLLYRATDKCTFTRWRTSIHMPRWASRITLVVTEARIERLQDISEEDANAEGCEAHGPGLCTENPDDYHGCWLARTQFSNLWRDLHGPDSWQANPEVVALTFTVHTRNIDQMEAA